MNLKKINFRQPKYIFPLVIAIPFGCLLYLLSDLFTSFGEEEEKPTDYINTELPEPNLEGSKSKMKMMQERYTIEDAFGAVDGFEKENDGRELLDDESGYSQEEAERIMADAEMNAIERQQIEEAQRKLEEAQRGYRNDRSGNRGNYRGDDEYDPYKEIDEIQRKRNAELRAILNEPDPDEKARIEREQQARAEAERKAAEQAPSEVIKADNLTHSMFNTVSEYSQDINDSPLIKAMIDQTTKTTDGTRLRFKLLDDVIVQDVKIKKGTYLYGTVSGFGQQRVKANIPSILVGDRFITVSLNVYDIDGMEGFYVPESSFRVFLQNAAAGVAGQSIQFNQNSGYSGGIDAENIALQAIQNVYQAASSAISGNLRKNKAKIKYNTIVYLINSK